MNYTMHNYKYYYYAAILERLNKDIDRIYILVIMYKFY